MSDHVYPIVPASGGVFWILIPLLLVAALLAYTTWSARNTTFTVSPQGLRIRGDLYGRTIPLADILTDQARVVDLTQDPDLKPGWRTNGVGLPGYQSGWFSLKGGGKGLLFVTDKRRVLALPTTEGYTLLLSPQDPEGLLTVLRQAGGRAALPLQI
jgi:hypothetical protein